MERRAQIRQAQRYGLGTVVLVVYIAAFALLLAGFSAYIIRGTVGEDLGNSDETLDILIFRGTRETELRDEITRLSADIAGIDGRITAIQSESRAIPGNVQLASVDMERSLSSLINDIFRNRTFFDRDWLDELEFMNRSGNEKSNYYGMNEEHLRKLAVLAARLPFAMDTSFVVSEDVRAGFEEQGKAVLAQLSTYRATLAKLEAEMDVKSLQSQNLEEQRQNIEMARQSAREELAVVSQNLGDRQRAILRSVRDGFGGLIYTMLKAPSILLTLSVTMASGALGAVVAFTRKFWRQRERTDIGRLMVNTGEGIAAALAIFLFAGSGTLLLASGGAAPAGGVVELNPYMVAFLAFLSGFMSEEAFNRIHAAGLKIFKIPDDNPANGNGHGNAAPFDGDGDADNSVAATSTATAGATANTGSAAPDAPVTSPAGAKGRPD